MRGASTASGFGGGASEQVSGAGVGVQRALSARGEVERGAGAAEEMAVEVQSGDVMVAATDGGSTICSPWTWRPSWGDACRRGWSRRWLRFSSTQLRMKMGSFSEAAAAVERSQPLPWSRRGQIKSKILSLAFHSIFSMLSRPSSPH
ncbi:hypothetical protein SASPL_140822 [Salvia splendens]|uniref:Uncharacterized protein n=1 Tax=Salvia splendens TaxID=180675 RepID=A0A8X8WPH3_SALSN|nr:hypothetical protein SASPL_140822 [Salvia splendens]